MKQLVMTLIIALMSVMVSTPVSAKSNKSDLKKKVPTNLIVKQTTQFSDGRTLVVYYKKQGTNCEVYSPCSAKDYNVSDASKIKSTNFEVVDKVEGKLYKKASIGEVTHFIKRMVNKYL
ncbi:hypothetical protein [Prevotella sp. E2-28]|uniref:hypothetical protein n=1 Tax=Prevotella sp. E2-28 TaxID=2913620 RepID=UPI001EDAAEF7|nr:hypothetical protein [Prevotella sp. E2-28]UKK55159.1 hypothetical protein L6465_14140 [Prevotella sp. E2-28]